MHPLLVRLSLGGFGVPLLPALVGLGLVGLGLIALGVMARQRAAFLLGCALSLAATGFALRPPFESFPVGALQVSSFGALCALASGRRRPWSSRRSRRS